MSVADRLNKLSTDITNAYTSIENKGGTIPANKNTNNLPTAIDSIEVIEQATAEGESLSLTNTKAMPYSDYVVDGKSEQATRSGKNLLNVTARTRTMNGVTITVNQDKSITLNGTNTSSETIFYRLADNFNLPAGTYTLSNHNNNVSNNNFIFYDDNYNFEERYNVVTKTFNTQKTIKPYLKVAAGITLNNEIIYPMIEKNSFMTDYEPYGASPSPDYPSEIHSVADDVNLFYSVDRSQERYGMTCFTKNNKITINGTATRNNFSVTYFNINGSQNANANYYDYDSTTEGIKLQAGTYTLKLHNITGTYTTTQDIFIRINKVYSGSTPTTTLASITLTNNETSKSFTLTEETTIKIRMQVKIPSDTSVAVPVFNNYSFDIKLQKGSTATPYSPYNQGTVTIKQRGKNLFDLKSYLTDRGVTYTENSDGSITFSTTINLYSNTFTFSSSNTNVSLSGIITNGTATNGRIQLLNSSNVVVGEITSSKISYENLNANQLRFNYSTSGTITLKNIQLEEGSTSTDYEPYQANDYTFQTAPLRSLPNGAKDTMELQDMQNHTRIGRQTGTLTETTTITLSDAKTDGAYMCNIKPSGTLTGKTLELEAGDYEIIYELAEEIIEPLTQNQATTMLDIIKTGSYEGTTNIYTDEDVKPTIGVGYYKKG